MSITSESSNFQGALPTYGELIDLFEQFGNDQHDLCLAISELFPSISMEIDRVAIFFS
jgi:fatty acid-binding protein DegV